MAGIFPSAGVPASQTQNALTNPDVTVGCAELWYAPRCNPKFDPFAANAVMSEIINAVNCADLDYNCGRLDNLCLAIRKIFDIKIVECIVPTFPLATGCTLESLVLSTDANGCRRIARYRESSARLQQVTTRSVWPEPTNIVFPINPADMTSYYNRVNIITDQTAGTIDAAKLERAHLFRMQFEIDCDNTIVDFSGDHGVILDPSAGGGDGAQGVFVPRIDGVFPQTAGASSLTAGFATNFQNRVALTFSTVLNAGAHVIDFYWIAVPGDQLAQITIGVQATGASGSVKATRGLS